MAKEEQGNETAELAQKDQPVRTRKPRVFNPDQPYCMAYDKEGMLQHWQNGALYRQSDGRRMD